VKNAADVSLIIDVVDSIAKRPEIENYVIASGDGIFAFLAKKLHEHGKRVIGCGFDRITNNIFRNACDYFITLEKSDMLIVATTSRRKEKSSAAEKKAAPEPPAPVIESPKVPRKFAKTKYSEALVQANIGIWKDIEDTSGCFLVVRQLIEALFVESTKDLSGLEVSVFVTYMAHYLPGFKVTRHGFKRVGEFMRFMLTGSPYCVYSIADNVLLMAPRATAEGSIMEDVKGLLIALPDGRRYNSVFNVPEGEQFVHTVSPPTNVEKVVAKRPPVTKPNTKSKTPKSKEPAAVIPAVPVKHDITVEGSIRKWIKTQFEELADSDTLPMAEVRKMTTEEYSHSTFGVRIPIFREIETRSNLTEQRTANGKVKYWKESFRFNGRTYLIFKEWVASLHQDRFIAWLAAHKQ